jgi:hypothetical protein
MQNGTITLTTSKGIENNNSQLKTTIASDRPPSNQKVNQGQSSKTKGKIRQRYLRNQY